jgi:hypothetical protein
MKFVKQAKVSSSIYRPVETLSFQEGEAPRISRQSSYEGAKYVTLKHQPALPPPPRRHPWYSFVLGLGRSQGHSAAGKIKSMKNPSYPIGNRTRNSQVCSAAPKPSAPHVVIKILSNTNFIHGALLLSFPFSSFVQKCLTFYRC